jgi:hypothetical protein
MPTIPNTVQEGIEQRAEELRRFFNLGATDDFIAEPLGKLELTAGAAEHLPLFNIEWHVIPPTLLVSFDEMYLARMYPMRSNDFDRPLYETCSIRQALQDAHRRVQGKLIGVEVTAKPSYLPGNIQFYGSRHGLDPSLDPFGPYIEKAGLRSGSRFINTRFAHTPATLRALGQVVLADWQSRKLIPKNYILTACPPTVFNLVGTIFHREWSETNSIELSSYRDDHGNAIAFAVGSNQPGDFSYIRRIGIDADLNLLGFRAALVPE